jgi:nucleoid-associated protein YgaU
MPRDAKLGLVVGVAVVILIAAVFYQNNGTAGGAPGSVGTPSPPGPATPTPPLPAGQRAARSHKVQEGDTLNSLAVQYYGDAAQSALLFSANRSQLLAPDKVPVGTVLLIPELAGAQVKE